MNSFKKIRGVLIVAIVLVAVFAMSLVAVAQAPAPAGMTADEMAVESLDWVTNHPEALSAVFEGYPTMKEISNTVEQVGNVVTVTLKVYGYMNGTEVTLTMPISFYIDLASSTAISMTDIPTETCGHASIGEEIKGPAWLSSDPNVVVTSLGQMSINVSRNTITVAPGASITVTGVISQNTWLCDTLLQEENYDNAPWRLAVDELGNLTKTKAPAVVE